MNDLCLKFNKNNITSKEIDIFFDIFTTINIKIQNLFFGIDDHYIYEIIIANTILKTSLRDYWEVINYNYEQIRFAEIKSSVIISVFSLVLLVVILYLFHY